MVDTAISEIFNFLIRDRRVKTFHNRIKVFGSSARGKENPGDVDILIDYRDFSGSILHPSEIPYMNLLLAMAAKFYGRFDPFVLVHQKLWCRDEFAQEWILARRQKVILTTAKLEGIEIQIVAKNYLNNG